MPNKINPAFGNLLKTLIKERSLSTRTFAEGCNTSHSWIAKVIRAEVLPSEENIKEWAAALKLEESEKQNFLEEGYLVRSHELIQDLVRNHRREEGVGK